MGHWTETVSVRSMFIISADKRQGTDWDSWRQMIWEETDEQFDMLMSMCVCVCYEPSTRCTWHSYIAPCSCSRYSNNIHTDRQTATQHNRASHVPILVLAADARAKPCCCRLYLACVPVLVFKSNQIKFIEQQRARRPLTGC